MMNVIFKEAAVNYIQKKLAGTTSHFRLSVKKTGCSGYSYFPKIVEEINAADTAIQVTPDLTVYVDTAWTDLLNGVEVDYIEEEKAGLKQKRLVFNNPNESSRCGCGESFHIE